MLHVNLRGLDFMLRYQTELQKRKMKRENDAKTPTVISREKKKRNQRKRVYARAGGRCIRVHTRGREVE